MSDPETLDALPIFPLPTVVLFPAVAAPLYIFEPRYRQMTAAALAGSGRIGMVTVDPRATNEMAGDPPVFDIGCMGEIRRSDERPDGTYHILLHGLRRFRIVREIPPTGDRLYRLAEAEVLTESEPRDPDPHIPVARARVLELMTKLLPDQSDNFATDHFAEVEDVHFVNAFCQAVEFPTLEKQKLLEANGVRARVDLLIGLLRFRLAEDATHAAGSRGTMH
jgi:Lon protease-like protein